MGDYQNSLAKPTATALADAVHSYLGGISAPGRLSAEAAHYGNRCFEASTIIWTLGDWGAVAKRAGLRQPTAQERDLAMAVLWERAGSRNGVTKEALAAENERLRGELQEARALIDAYPWGQGSTSAYLEWANRRAVFLASHPSPEAQQ